MKDGVYSTEKLSKDDDYYSQRNNKIDPMISCQVTAYINAMVSNGLDLNTIIPKDSKYDQPEDYFNSLFELDEVKEYAKKVAPWYKGKYIREIHDVLSYTCNKYLLKDSEMKSRFSTNVTIKECFESIVKDKKAFVASGTFCGFGHVVAVTGVTYDKKRIYDADCGIKYFILDDPYGNYHKQYKDPYGNDILMPFEDFKNMIKNEGEDKKWIHLFN